MWFPRPVFCLYREEIITVDEILHKANQKRTEQALQSYFSTYITVEWSSTVESRLNCGKYADNPIDVIHNKVEHHSHKT
jgi:hypothetical protein